MVRVAGVLPPFLGAVLVHRHSVHVRINNNRPRNADVGPAAQLLHGQRGKHRARVPSVRERHTNQARATATATPAPPATGGGSVSLVESRKKKGGPAKMPILAFKNDYKIRNFWPPKKKLKKHVFFPRDADPVRRKMPKKDGVFGIFFLRPFSHFCRVL